MRKVLKALLFFLFVVITVLGLKGIQKYLQNKQSYSNWVECIETGSGSDADCERCDALFQPEGERYTMPEY